VSLDVIYARQQLDVIAGRRQAAGVWLPSNPVVAFSLASRTPPRRAGEPQLLNWYVTLSQEIEIAGQRGARLDRVDAEAAAQVRRVAVAEQEVAAQALNAYYDALAAAAVRDLTHRLGEVATLLNAYADERAKASLIAPVDADLVRAETVRIGVLHHDAGRRLATAQAHLATFLGRDPTASVELGSTLIDDSPRPPDSTQSLVSLTDRALQLRGEIAAADMERAVFERQLRVLRRGRAPNVTISTYAQRDGIDEQVFGAGLSMPIPLPGPVGRTNRGEIAELTALSVQAVSTIEIARRRVREEVAEAHASERFRGAALRLYPADLVARAATDLANIREGLIARQLSVRDAVIAERTLIDLLLGEVEAQFQYALAWVELHRASGQPLAEEVTR